MSFLKNLFGSPEKKEFRALVVRHSQKGEDVLCGMWTKSELEAKFQADSMWKGVSWASDEGLCESFVESRKIDNRNHIH